MFPYWLKWWAQTLTSCGHSSYPRQMPTMQAPPPLSYHTRDTSESSANNLTLSKHLTSSGHFKGTWRVGLCHWLASHSQ